MIKFGSAGNSDSFFEMGLTDTMQTPKYLFDKGLNAFEYSFGRGANLGTEKAALFGAEFVKYNIEISVHAPYYINFANIEEENIKKSVMYITSSLKRLRAMGGKRCVYHMATCGKQSRANAAYITQKNTEKLLAEIYRLGYNDMILCPETMGKTGQIGTVDEVLEICKMDKIFIPTFDFGHINSREQGLLKSKDDYKIIIEKLFSSLDEYRAKNIHIHFSKIQYGKFGEIRHLKMDNKEYGPEFEPLAELLCEYKMTPVILSESAGSQAEDAVLMKNIYLNALVKYNKISL